MSWTEFDYTDKNTWPPEGDCIAQFDAEALAELGYQDKPYPVEFWVTAIYGDPVFEGGPADDMVPVIAWHPLPELPGSTEQLELKVKKLEVSPGDLVVVSNFDQSFYERDTVSSIAKKLQCNILFIADDSEWSLITDEQLARLGLERKQ